MKSFILAVSVVSPLLIYMLVGSLIKKMNWFSQDSFQSLNGVIFKIFLPLALFFDVYEADLNEAVKPQVFIFTVIGVIIIYVLVWMITVCLVKEKADSSTMIQGIFRSNFVLFGNSIAVSMCDASGTALTAALAAVIVPLYNILAVILFESMRGGRMRLSKVIVGIIKNPLVEAGILGILCNIFQIRFPDWFAAPFMRIGDIATPLALITLGGMLSLGSIVKHKNYLIAAVAGRLVLVPLVVLITAVLLGFRGQILIILLSVFAAPTAVASAPMAQAMGGNGALAGEIVVLTSACCILTIFLFVFGLSGIGLI
ncbi:MAG: AEC family transporter [Bariatricus sp.]